MTYHGPVAEIDLAALARNYQRLAARAGNAQCAGVVKANAYGLGLAPVARALWGAGCRVFFVATLDEAVACRGVLAEAIIYVFRGVRASEVADFEAHCLRPVLNDPGQIDLWSGTAAPETGAYALHVDTGMERLGLSAKECGSVSLPPGCALLMSHLACAGEPFHPMNAQQLARFESARARMPELPASLANSSGIFLGRDYHFDVVRPGCSLYGISPDMALPNPVEGVVTLSSPVLQYRRPEAKASVGYSATATVGEGRVLATVETGYADGFLRSLSNNAYGFMAGVRVPLVGRVSMDMVSLDVTEVPEHRRTPDARVTFIGAEQGVDTLAEQAGTIGYEMLTGLGSRVTRVYR